MGVNWPLDAFLSRTALDGPLLFFQQRLCIKRHMGWYASSGSSARHEFMKLWVLNYALILLKETLGK